MPEGSSQYIYLQNKNWRALGYNWDILSQYDNTQGKLYCLTDFQAAWLLSNTEYMRWSTRWQNCPCTQADMDAMKAEMEFNLMSCIDFQPYQLQALFDGLGAAEIDRYTADWNGSDPSSVNPDAPDDYFDGDASPEREDALCTALTLWAYSYAADWITKASTILGIGAALGEIVNFLIPVGGTIAVKVIKDLSAPLQAQVDALNNLDRLDEVICDWREGLEGVAINASNWTDAVQDLVYPLSTDLWYIQQLFAADTQILGNFLSFVNSLGEGYELAQLGVFVCACDEVIEETITVTYDGSGYGDYVIVEGSLDGSNGNPAPSGTSAYNSGINTTRNVTDVNLAQPSTVTSLNWQGYVVPGSGVWSFFILLYDADDNVLYSDLDTGQTVFGSWIDKDYPVLSVANVSRLRFIVGKTGSGHTLRQDNLTVTYEYVS